MAYTPSLRLTLPLTGTLDGTWGDTVNNGITSLTDTAIAGTAAVIQGDVANYTLTSNSGATDEARSMFLNITGALTAARNVVCPTVSKLYFIKNSTTGGFAITLKTTAGTGISIPNGGTIMALYCDGTNVIDAVSYLSALKIGGLTASQAVFTDANKNLVSNAITGTGNVVMSTSPTLVTPALGTPSALVGTNITGTATNFTASNVTTNANLTGAVTSSGNATSLGSFTSLQLLTALTNETGTGAAVFATSPTLGGTIAGTYTLGGTPTINAFTLAGTVSGGGNQINNVIIGASTPLAGSFTTVSSTGAATLQGLTVGKGVSTFTTNTVIGNGAMAAAGNSEKNTAVGYQALALGNGGSSNNTAVGYQTLDANLGGFYNTAVGDSALGGGASNTNACAIGAGALAASSAAGNVAVGRSAMTVASSASYNTAIGYNAADTLTTGTRNVAVGSDTMGAITTGSYNVAVGDGSMGGGTPTGVYNTCVGSNSGFTLNSGEFNTLVGPNAGTSITTGSYNTIVGPFTGSGTTLDIATLSGYAVISSGVSGTPITKAVFNQTGVAFFVQPTPTAKAAAATLTGAEVATQILTLTGTGYGITLPTASALDTALGSVEINTAFRFTVINGASGTVGLVANTNITIVGSVNMFAATSVSFLIRKTAATPAYTAYRI